MKNMNAFYPYTIKSGQSASMIAIDYYGDADLEWLVYFSNNIIDPYYGWVLTDEQFNKFIIKKYGSFEYAADTIHHYVYNPTVDKTDPRATYTDGYMMTPETFSFLSVDEKSFWRPLSIYDYEFAKNEQKRQIRLLDRRLVDQIVKEINSIMK